MSCYCGLEPSFEACCEPYIRGDKPPPTAEALMRSRYSAYVVENVDYILATHAPGAEEEADRDATAEWSERAEWLGLTVHEVKGDADAEEGIVEFTASYDLDDRVFKHRERAVFRKFDGAWRYVDGEMVKPKPVVRDSPKIGRNDPCSCGSGKKYKKCCGR